MNTNKAWLALVLLFLVLAQAACSGPSETATLLPVAPTATAAVSPPPKPSATAAQTATAAASPTPVVTITPSPQPSPTTNPILSLGQVVKVNDLAMAVIGVEFSPDQVQVMFAAKNTGSVVVTVSAIYFSVIPAGGLAQQAVFCKSASGSTQGFNGVLEPGDILRGTICWETKAKNAGQDRLQVIYTLAYGERAAVTWDVSKPGAVEVPAEIATSGSKTPIHPQGETVTQKDFSVTFDGITLSSDPQVNTKLMIGSFTVENKGSSSVKLPSIGSSFILKTADGYTFLQPISGHLCQNSFSDVEIKAGQKLSFTVCYTTSGPSVTAGTTARFISPDRSWFAIWALK